MFSTVLLYTSHTNFVSFCKKFAIAWFFEKSYIDYLLLRPTLNFTAINIVSLPKLVKGTFDKLPVTKFMPKIASINTGSDLADWTMNWKFENCLTTIVQAEKNIVSSYKNIWGKLLPRTADAEKL